MKILKWLFAILIMFVTILCAFSYVHFISFKKGPLDTDLFMSKYVESGLSLEIAVEAIDEIKNQALDSFDLEIELNKVNSKYVETQINNFVVGVHGYFFGGYEKLPRLYIEPIKEDAIDYLFEIIYSRDIKLMNSKKVMTVSNVGGMDKDKLLEVYNEMKEKYGEENIEAVLSDKTMEEKLDMIEEVLDEKEAKEIIEEIYTEEKVKDMLTDENLEAIKETTGIEVSIEEAEEIINEVINSDNPKEALKNATKELLFDKSEFSNVSNELDTNIFVESLFNTSNHPLLIIKNEASKFLKLTDFTMLFFLLALIIILFALTYDIKYFSLTLAITSFILFVLIRIEILVQKSFSIDEPRINVLFEAMRSIVLKNLSSASYIFAILVVIFVAIYILLRKIEFSERLYIVRIILGIVCLVALVFFVIKQNTEGRMIIENINNEFQKIEKISNENILEAFLDSIGLNRQLLSKFDMIFR